MEISLMGGGGEAKRKLITTENSPTGRRTRKASPPKEEGNSFLHMKNKLLFFSNKREGLRERNYLAGTYKKKKELYHRRMKKNPQELLIDRDFQRCPKKKQHSRNKEKTIPTKE